MTTLPLTGTVNTGGAGVNVNLDAIGIAPFSLINRMIKLRMVVDDPFKVGAISLFVGTSSLANNIKWRFWTSTSSSRPAKPGEAFTVTLQMSEINTVAGSISLSPSGVPSASSGFTDIRLQVSDNATGPVQVQLLSVELVEPDVPGAFLSIVFDDANESIVSRAFPKMRSLGLPGTSYVIADAIGSPGRTTLQGCQALAADGWEIAGHAGTVAGHSNGLTALTGQQVSDDLAAMHSWLVANFPDPQNQYSFAYPLGKYENTTDGVAVESLVAANGFTSARTILSDAGVSTHTQIESLPPAMPMRMNAMSGISSLSPGQFNPATLVGPGGMLDKLAANGGWMILVFHIVVAGAPAATTEISQADFDLIMDAIAARQNSIRVAPVREVLRFTPEDIDGVLNIYRVAGSTVSVVPTLDRVWLKSVARPFLNRAVTVFDYSEVERSARSGVFDVVGRSLPVSVSDVRGSRRWTLELLTETAGDAQDLDLLLASGDPLLVHVPADCGVPGGYVEVGDARQRRTARRTERRVFELPCVEVAAPGPDVIGSTVTCQSVLNEYPTCQAVLDAHPTCLDLMELIGDPTDVVVP